MFFLIIIIVFLFINNKKKIAVYTSNENLGKIISQKNLEFLLIDIRSEQEYKFSHLPSAVNIPYNRLLSTLPAENMFLTIIVYGDTKKESSRAAELLGNRGYFNVTNYGSISRWKGELINHEHIGETTIENSGKGRANLPV
ncbi:MAG: rhodanese-like domain-containing protein [bacterium]|nr:rhodanese-like domain-containing protein [bacterium]